jgi:hypothetical protein
MNSAGIHKNLYALCLVPGFEIIQNLGIVNSLFDSR